jgi:gamma-glutamylcyclotransferase (GGCT)/AIG2-like uncharacterized protein YtfP
MKECCKHLFVYGTLRKASQDPMSQVLASHAEYLDEASIQGKLFDAGEYPAATVSTKKGHVYGEVFKINNESLLQQLDEFEGCSSSYDKPHEYIREKVTSTLVSGELVDVWMYVFNGPTDSLHYIKSGDYMAYLGIPVHT